MKYSTFLFILLQSSFIYASHPYDKQITKESGNLLETYSLPGLPVPVITLDLPGTIEGFVGSTVTLSVTCSGTNLSYQWYKDNEPIAGATAAILTIVQANKSHQGNYHCEITDATGMVTSNTAFLHVIQPLILVQEPQDQIIWEGKKAGFEANTWGDLCWANPNDWMFTYGSVGTWDESAKKWTVTGRSMLFAIPEKMVPIDYQKSYTLSIEASRDNDYVVPMYWGGKRMMEDKTTLLPGYSGSYDYGATVGAKYPPVGEWTTYENVGRTGTTYNYLGWGSVDCKYYLPGGLLNWQNANQTTHVRSIRIFDGEIEYVDDVPTVYQWQKDGVDIPGANGKKFTIDFVAAENEGTYRCMITKGSQTIYTREAVMELKSLPIVDVLDFPENTDRYVGDTIVFSIPPSSADLSYQWYKNNDPVEGETTTSYTIAYANKSHEGNYRCEITDATGTVTSNTTFLHVIQPLILVQEPEGQIVNEGESAGFEVNAWGDINWKDYNQWDDSFGNFIWDETKNAWKIQGFCGIYMKKDFLIPVDYNKAYDLSIEAFRDNDEGRALYWGGRRYHEDNSTLTSYDDYSVTQGRAYPAIGQWTKYEIFGKTGLSSDYYGWVSSSCKYFSPGGYINHPAGTQITYVKNIRIFDGEIEYVDDVSTVYQWQKDGVDIPGANGKKLAFESVSPADRGMYRCVITKGAQVINTKEVMLGIQDDNLSVTHVITSAGITVSVSGGVPPYTCHWSNGQSGPSVTCDTYGTYTVNISDAALSFTQKSIDFYVPQVSQETETHSYNWVYSKAFGAGETVVGESKSFSDHLGRGIQSQVKNLSENKVLVTQTLHDALGRAVLTTIPAAVTNASMEYFPHFIVNPAGEDYTYQDFDRPDISGALGEANNPEHVNPVIPNTLGWYYSNNNTYEPYVPGSRFPYSRVHYSQMIPGQVCRSSAPGEFMRSGSGHEVKTFTLPAAENELSSYVSLDSRLIYKGLTKIVTVDPNGKESIVYQTEDGKVVAANTNNAGIQKVPKIYFDTELGYADIHIPINNFISILVYSNTYYDVYDLESGDLLMTNVKNVYLPPGFYRFNNRLANPGGTHYVYYYHYCTPPSLNIYDDAGRLVKTFSPQAVADNDPARCSTYEYNSLGWLIRTGSPDEGMTEYVYRKDGSVRFSQNAVQRVSGKFSYTNYDGANRAIEVGEYEPGAGGLTFSTTMDPEATLANGTFTDQTFTSYDEPDATFVLDGYEQKFLTGAVSKAWTNQDITWYSYTYDGKVDWVVQDIDGLGLITLDYAYDFNGNVTHVIYQKDVASEYFEHLYAYDADLRLSRVTTRECPTCTPEEQARYEYYAHGPLKRVVLAENLQGIDYVYNINGWLKSMNHPDLATNLDPGRDGAAGSTVEPDVFGMSLDYYSGDYQRENTSIPSHYGSNYNGNIAATRWKTDAPSVPQLPVTGKHWVYKYGYDNRNWLTTADFGTHEALGDVMGGMPYRIYAVNYDFNGNLKTYYRYGLHNFVDLFTYNYITGTNKLDYLNDGASAASYPDDVDNQQPGNYTYNAIGQMTGNAQDGHFFTYNAYGKVSAIYSDAAHNNLLAEYDYDDGGFRVRKRDYVNNIDTWYVRDVSGNILSIYEDQYDGNGIALTEVPLYGASRLGVNQKSDDKYLYELADHLGNVRATVYRDGATDHLAVETWADYYPFGMVLPGRSSSAGNYRFGYQGQFAEKDPETGYNQFEARLWDSRIARWLVPDPAGQYYSPYLGMGNNPINGVDPDGSKLWPWKWKIFTGDGPKAGISFIGDDGKKYITNLSGISITAKRTAWSKFWNALGGGGIHFTWEVGQALEQRRTTRKDIKSQSIGQLMDAIIAAKRLYSTKPWQNLGEPIDYISDGTALFYSATPEMIKQYNKPTLQEGTTDNDVIIRQYKTVRDGLDYHDSLRKYGESKFDTVFRIYGDEKTTLVFEKDENGNYIRCEQIK